MLWFLLWFVSPRPGAFAAVSGSVRMLLLAAAPGPQPQGKHWPCHVSDYSRGFGGKYGVQKDRMDKVSGSRLGVCGGRRARVLRSTDVSGRPVGH